MNDVEPSEPVMLTVHRHGQTIRGRGAADNPLNRFEKLDMQPDADDADDGGGSAPATVFFKDSTRRIIVTNDSPDVGFNAGINPYRGCEHGCIYCYARPTHEYLGFSAGLDFESRIMVKTEAPEMLRRELAEDRWRPRVLGMSGVTDCYQPIERKLELTRGCLKVLAEFRNPVAIITKSHLVTRDIDVLAELAGVRSALVMVSLTTLDAGLTARMEPRAATPARRLAAIAALAAANVAVGVMVAPVVPGLTDHEIPSILQAAADAGAVCCGYEVLRLPHAVAGLFEDWLQRHFPDRKEKVLNRVRSLRGGKLNDPRFGSRMRGEGVWADQLRSLFAAARKKAGLDRSGPELSTAAFRAPWMLF